VIGRVLLERAPIHIRDVETDPEYRMVEVQKIGGYHSTFGVPLWREGALIGVLVLARCSVRPFTDNQIALVESFADQAVIAIENVRLFEAEQQRTRELTESLEQQTATSEVLQVISRSPGELDPVFAAMLENAVRVCDSKSGNVYRLDGEALHLLAAHNSPPALVEHRRRTPYRPRPNAPMGRVIATKRLVHVVDAAADEAYVQQRDPGITAAVELGGIRTALYVPMLKENELIGVFTVFPPLHRQADRASQEFRRPGRHRHREHAAVK
jgi:GAF domain-containing protein